MSQDTVIGITGGLGLIGKNLRKELSSPVVFVSRQEPPTAIQTNERCLVGSFADPAVMEDFCSNVNVLVHTATAVGPRSEFDFEIVQNDLVGTINLAKVFFKYNPRGHFIFLSTAGGLYNLEDHSPKNESSPIDPRSVYGSVKLIIEDALENICGSEGRVTVLRPTPTYGDSLKKNQKFGLIDMLLKSVLNDSSIPPVEIFVNINSSRDYLHVNDLILAILAVVERKRGARYEVYNVGTGIETSIYNVIRAIEYVCDKKVNYKVIPTDEDPSSLLVNYKKILDDVNWRPTITLQEGIALMYQDLILYTDSLTKKKK